MKQQNKVGQSNNIFQAAWSWFWNTNDENIEGKSFIPKTLYYFIYGVPIVTVYLFGGWAVQIFWHYVLKPQSPKERTKTLCITFWIIAALGLFIKWAKNS